MGLFPVGRVAWWVAVGGEVVTVRCGFESVRGG